MAGMVFGGRGGSARPPLKQNETHNLLLLGIGGTLIEGSEEITSLSVPHSLRVLPGVREILEAYRQGGWVIVTLSNQPNIGLRRVNPAFVQEWHAVLVNKTGNRIDAALYCPHSPEADTDLFRICSCRKPKYGMCVTAHGMVEQIFEAPFPHAMQLIVGGELERQMAEAAGLAFKSAEEWRADSIRMLATQPLPERNAV